MDFKEYFNNPLNGSIMDLEYSVIYDGHGSHVFHGNSEPHFRKSLELGFHGLKADMRLSSDGEIILCHDSGYSFDDNGRIAGFSKDNHTEIHDMTLAQIQNLEFANPDEKGKHYSPCTLKTMLSICSEHKSIAYLTLRYEPWQLETAKRMVELILANDMQDRTIINLYPGKAEAVKLVASLLPGLVYCNTRMSGEPLTTEMIDFSADSGFKIICLCRSEIESVTPELVKYAASKGIRIWAWMAWTLEEVAIDLAHGITGFQMYNNMGTPEAIDKLIINNE